MYKFVASVVLGSSILSINAMAMPGNWGESSGSASAAAAPAPSSAITREQKALVHSWLPRVNIHLATPGFETGEHSFARLMAEGPILNQEDEANAQAELAEVGNSKEFRLYASARRFNVNDMIRMGGHHRDQDNMSEAYHWFLLAFACSFVQQASDIKPTDLAWKYLDDLGGRIQTKIEPDKDKKGKKIRRSAAQNKEQQELVEMLQSIVTVLASATLKPAAPTYARIVGFAEVIAQACSQFKEEIQSFMVLASDDKYLYPLAMEYRNRDDRDISREDELQLFKSEMRCFQRLNSSLRYFEMGSKYFSLATLPENPAHSLRVNRILNQDDFYQRAAYYFSLSNDQNALYALGRLLNQKQIAADMELSERLQQCETFYVKSGCKEGFFELGQAYVLAVEDAQYGRIPPLEPETVADYSHKAKQYLGQYLEDASFPTGRDIELDLAMAHEFAGETTEAINILQRTGTAKALNNLGWLYCNIETDNEEEVRNNLRHAAHSFRAALRKDPELQVPLYGLYKVYGKLKACALEAEREKYARKATVMFTEVRASRDAHFLRPSDFALMANFLFELNDYDAASSAAEVAVAGGYKSAQQILDMIDARSTSDPSGSSSSSEDTEESTHVGNEPECLESDTSLVLRKPVVVDVDYNDEDDYFSDVSAAADALSFSERDSALGRLSKRERKIRSKREAFQRKRKALQRELNILARARIVNPLLEKRDEPKWTINFFECEAAEDNRSKIDELSADILAQPWGLYGSGKPEILKNSHRDFGMAVYSRHITDEHRLIYVLETNTNTIHILSTVGHYDNLGRVVQRYKENSQR